MNAFVTAKQNSELEDICSKVFPLSSLLDIVRDVADVSKLIVALLHQLMILRRDSAM